MNMKKIAYLSLGLMLTLTSCEYYDNIIPEEYNKILSMKVFGEQDLTLYETGEQTEYNIVVMKSGAKPDETAEATVDVMNEAQFEKLKTESGRPYKMLPAECFALSDNKMKFGSTDMWKTAKLTIDPMKVKKYVEESPNYVLPVITTSQSDSILATANTLVLKSIQIIKPAVSFGDVTNYSITKEIGKDGGTVEIPFTMQIDNLWDFNTLVGVVPDLTTFDTSDYSLADGGKVAFTKGAMGKLKIDFQPMKHAIAKLGLQIKGMEGKSFGYDETPVVLTARVPKYPLTAAMLSSNAVEPSEGSLANLLDGDINTYFHSSWSVWVDPAHYVQIDLPEAVSSFAFSYTNRSSNGNAAMADFSVYAGNDESSLVELKHYTMAQDNLPGGAAGVFNSGELKPSEPVKIIRFVHNVNKTNEKFFVWSEFSLFAI